MRHIVHDVALNVEESGDPHGAPLLLIHGFMGSAETWKPHLAPLSRHRRILAVDVVGHGQSDAPVETPHYRMEIVVRDLWALLDALGVERLSLLGYSMGARIALQMAVASPTRVEKLVLEGGTPGLDDDMERRARRAADERQAFAIEMDGVEAFVTAWEQQPLFATQQALPDEVREKQREQRRKNTAVGLANSLRCTGVGAQTSLWNRLGFLTMPVLLIAGDLDHKFRLIALAMAERLPAPTTAIVPGAGHAVHLEHPIAFDQLVTQFIDAPPGLDAEPTA